MLVRVVSISSRINLFQQGAPKRALFYLTGIMAGMVSKKSPDNDSKTAIFHTLRQKLLSLDPEEIDIHPGRDYPEVWGVLMDTTYPDGIASLAALADGTTSLYLSTGGGMIGSGSQPLVSKAAKHMVQVAGLHLEQSQLTMDYPLPPQDHVRFYLLTFKGVRSAGVSLLELQMGGHPLSELFKAGHELITQINLVSEKQQKG